MDVPRARLGLIVEEERHLLRNGAGGRAVPKGASEAKTENSVVLRYGKDMKSKHYDGEYIIGNNLYC